MSEQSDLAYLIGEQFEHQPHQETCTTCRDVEAAAAAVLTMGYRKLRQVTTVEELDALPTDSVVRSRGEIVWEKFSDEDDIVCWRTPGSKAPAAGLNISLPATVLHEGTL